jgi:hypothetical protein
MIKSSIQTVKHGTWAGAAGKLFCITCNDVFLQISVARYRNFLMACGALMNQKQQPLYFPLLDSPISPSIRNLQVWIEAAWKEG